MATLEWLPEPAWRPSLAEYHGSIDWWGSSMLHDFHDSPGLAFQRYVEHTSPTPTSSASMTLGTLVHTLILEPERYDKAVHVVEVRSKTAKAYKDAKHAHPDKLIVIVPEHDKAQRIANAIRKPRTEGAEIAKALLLDRPGVAEYSYRWEDVLGVRCKVRFDWLTETRRGPAMVNLKTSVDPSTSGFQRQALNLSYHAQQAFYDRGFRHLTGGIAPDALLVVIGNEPPHEVSVKQASEEFLAYGRQRVEEDLRNLATALRKRERSHWVGKWELGVETLELPRWARPRVTPSDAVMDTF